MKKVLYSILIVLSLVILSSCTAETVAPDDSWESVFLQFWNTMNMEYPHFDIETDLDWDEVYENYLPLFRKLDYAKEEDSITAFTYFKEIAINVSDCHFQLIVRDNFNNFLWMTPADERKWESLDRKNDHRDYPDISYKGAIVSANARETPVTDDEMIRFHEAVDGYYEVSRLTAKGTFHNTGTAFKAYKGYSFKTYEKSEAETDKAKEAWNDVVNAFDIDGLSYYCGVTDENIFYFYFSYFFSYADTPLSEELIYEKTLKTEEDKEKLRERKVRQTDNTYLQFHDYIWERIDQYNLSGEVPYFRGIYEMFEILKSIGKDGKCTMTDTSGEEKEYTIKGVVMDVRGNAGGDNTTLESVFGSFFQSETKFAETRYKDGYNRYEYGPWLDLTIEKKYCTAPDDYNNPFIIITNGNSVSCAELSAGIVKNLMKKGSALGGTTYGATCTKVKRALYHSGTFSSKNLNIVMASLGTKLKTKDGSFVSFENKGIEPTDGQYVGVDSTYERDTRFEKAVELAGL